ncbi:MAG TPA: hypothetical protein VF478_03740 [Anaerolineae bacterium]
MIAPTSAGASEGQTDSTKAAAPATCGHAPDVPHQRIRRVVVPQITSP